MLQRLAKQEYRQKDKVNYLHTYQQILISTRQPTL